MTYRYAIEVLTPDGRALGRAVATPDWAAALEWTRFEGVRSGLLRPVNGVATGVVEPVWDGRSGAPYVSAFRAVVEAEEMVTREIPKTYLRGIAQQAAAGLVDRGVLEAGAAFRWVVSAYPAAPVATGSASDPFQVDEEVRPLPVDYASLAALSERALPVDADEAPDAVPVFIPAHVLAEAAAQAQAAGDVETGGVLVGKLRRDDGAPAGTSPALFVEVTAQVPARHTVATATRLTFTAETWAAVRAAIALRRGGELLLGWWHAHVDFCRVRGCPPERRALCTAADPFLSAEDLLLHATMFGSAYQLALLVSDSTARGQTCSLYGWSHGMVRRRGFHLVKGEIDAAHVPAGF